MKCPCCGHVFKAPGQARGGRAKVPKGFAINKVARAKALATRRRNREALASPPPEKA